MFSFLKNHPFAVQAFFKKSIVLTFAVPKEELQKLIPACLTLDTLNNKWGFIAVAMVETKNLRPKGFPEFLGNDFFLTGYRVFVRYTNRQDKNLRGLYILKSETDKKKMEFLGNIFTHYNYSFIDIINNTTEDLIEIFSEKTGLKVVVQVNDKDIALPQHSPFTDWKEARRFAGPLPFTFNYNSPANNVLIVEGIRQNWHPTPVKINYYHIPYLNSLCKEIHLANAFMIEKIPYQWKKGKLEKCRP